MSDAYLTRLPADLVRDVDALLAVINRPVIETLGPDAVHGVVRAAMEAAYRQGVADGMSRAMAVLGVPKQ